MLRIFNIRKIIREVRQCIKAFFERACSEFHDNVHRDEEVIDPVAMVDRWEVAWKSFAKHWERFGRQTRPCGQMVAHPATANASPSGAD